MHLKRSNKCLEALRHWVPASSRGGYMLDTKEKWVRGTRQSMTTEKCMTKICGPKLPTIKEMGCPNPTQLLNVDGNWQNTFPCTDQAKLPYKSCTNEEAEEHIKKQAKNKKQTGKYTEEWPTAKYTCTCSQEGEDSMTSRTGSTRCHKKMVGTAWQCHSI